MNVSVGSDHGGYLLKTHLVEWLRARNMEVDDLGCASADSCDYPDFAAEVARQVSEGRAERGVLVCTTGIGMSISANRFVGVRAALCLTPAMAVASRRHNDANILALGASLTSPGEAEAILDLWLNTAFDGGRHDRRVRKIDALPPVPDRELEEAIQSEIHRQHDNLELIASENYTSAAVRRAVGSVLTNKYAEGYPDKRWYGGCEYVDVVERLAIERARSLFGAEHANVQPHCGSSANMAVYFAMLQPGDTLLAMSLADGGHLTHGHKMNFSGRYYRVIPYGVARETERIDYETLERLARENKPRMICAGASAYSRIIDFPRLRAIADEVGAWLMVDMAHIAGLVAAGQHPSPVPFADFVTTTTHKTLRGPRGGMVLCKEKFAAEIDKQIFPGIQGGPLMHVIAGKAVCFHEALQPGFKTYQSQVVRNAQVLAAELEAGGLRLVSGGTDNHLMLVDLTPIGVTGKEAASVLDRACITVNKNAIPFDPRNTFVTSGIRIGTPAVTTRGMGEPEMKKIAGFILRAVSGGMDEAKIFAIRREVLELTSRFPVP